MSVILPFPDDENHIIVFSDPCYNPIMSKRIDHLDVICQISHDGTVIPLRIQVFDQLRPVRLYFKTEGATWFMMV